VVSLSEGIDQTVSGEHKPIGLLVDLSRMEGASLSTRFEEMRFLQQHTEQIARMAVISDNEWQEVYQMILVATVAIPAQTRYFHSSQIHRAWRWVKMAQTTTDPSTQPEDRGNCLG
jgi:hypothetical protein